MIRVHIRSIDALDMMAMSATLTLEINLTWRDSRLTFAQLVKNKTTLIPTTLENQLWLPINDMYQVNAIVGKITKDNDRHLSIISSKFPQPVDIGRDREDVLYKGADNILQVKQNFRIEYNCVFDVSKYPFDTNRCNFIMGMKKREKISTIFVKNNESVKYSGSKHISQFEIDEIFSSIQSSNNETFFIVTAKINSTCITVSYTHLTLPTKA